MPTPRPGESGYGTAPEGSLSEERAKKAAIWVEKEVYKLLGEIESLGKTSGNEVTVTFGELFIHYQDVSDTLVGIMARAKKRNLIKYEGQGGHMLFQGKHDNVVVTLDKAKTAAWRKEYLSGATAETVTTPSPAKKLTVKEQYEEEKKRKANGTSPSSSPPPTTIKSEPSPQTKPKVVETQSPQTNPKVAETPSPKPDVVETPPVLKKESPGFFASLIGVLMPSSENTPSPPSSEVTESEKKPSPAPSPVVSKHEGKKPEQTHAHNHNHQHQSKTTTTTTISPPKSVDNATATKNIMAKLQSPVNKNNEISDDVMNSIRASARIARQEQETKKPANSSVLKLNTGHNDNTHHPHAALPQRTRDGTRGAVLKTPPSPAHKTPAAAPGQSTSSSSATTTSAKSSPASPTLRKEQEEWTKKHINRGVVSAKSSPYDKLAPFAEDKHKSTPASMNVSKKADSYEKNKQSSTMPTGLKKRFAWE